MTDKLSAFASFGPERSIVWLASYPKSGNTWLRSLLTAYMAPDEGLDINALIGQQDPFDRQMLDDHAGITSGDMTAEELIPYQAQLHRELSRQAQPPYFIKTHSAFVTSPGGHNLFPACASAGAILIVRNPIDVVPSLAHHDDRDFDWAIARMGDDSAGMDQWDGRTSLMLPQKMGSWSGYAQTWLEQGDIPLHLLRYEDLHSDPEAFFGDVLRFCAIEVDQNRLRAAVESCKIDKLQQTEAMNGFVERPSPDRAFFRGGRIGDGQEGLSAVQKQRLWDDHSAIMLRLGYTVHG